MTSVAGLGARRLWWWYAIAAATFLPTIGFYYVGEEAIFPLSSYEMWWRGDWWRHLLFGLNKPDNPLYNWLIIPFAAALGWDHVLPVARVITITATVATGLVAAWLARTLYANAVFAAFAALVYLTLADTFFYRGWLVYVDPLFGFLLFSSVACLWVACERRDCRLLALAVAMLTLAFLAKSMTAYVYYGVAGAVLLARRDYREFLLAPASWLLHVAAVAAPLLWLFAVQADSGHGSHQFGQILAKLVPDSLGDYVVKLITYPMETITKLAPAMLLALWYSWKRRNQPGAPLTAQDWTLIAVALLNYAPFWLAPRSHMRYLTPLYPLFALIIARWLWISNERAPAVTLRWIAAMIALKTLVVVAAFPWYQHHYRGENHLAAARDIVERTKGSMLYSSNVSASGLSVTAQVSILRRPQPPVTYPPAQWTNGYVIAYTAAPTDGLIAAHYRLGGDNLYLLCRGTACGK